MSVIHNDLLLSTDEATGYNLTKSLRFRSSASAYLSRTPASAGNRKTWTWSSWVKRGTLGSTQMILSAGVAQPATDGLVSLRFESGDTLRIVMYESGTGKELNTTQVFRDPSAWYHIVVTLDTTQATSSNRLKFYVNGSQITSFATANYPTQNYDFGVNDTKTHNIARYYYDTVSSPSYFDGYMTEVNFVDGTGLTPSSFGENDTITGVWKPKRYTGTYGTNGFYLKFTDNATATPVGLGEDFSNAFSSTIVGTSTNASTTLTVVSLTGVAVGNTVTGLGIPTGTYVTAIGTLSVTLSQAATSSNVSQNYVFSGNNWTPNNISVTAGTTYDSMTDVPTLTSATQANYCVMSPVYVTPSQVKPSVSNGNLTLAVGGSDAYTQSTFAVPRTGKYYWEVTYSSSSLLTTTGIATSTNGNGSVYVSNGQVYILGTLQGTTVGAWSNGDVIGMAVDMDANTLKFYKNNTLQTTITAYSGTADVFVPSYLGGGGTGSISYNFGQQGFTYTPPTGHLALNTYNLPDSTIVAGNKVMDATTYTGNGSTQTITNAGSFSPDLIWIKSRSNAYNHFLTDSVRGASKYLISNAADAEADAGSAGITAFNSNGFSMGSGTALNANAATYVGWQWRGSDSSAVSNTSGSITSTVSVNATAGFSVVTYTGTGANATVGHGLGVAPKFLLVKNRSGVYNWRVWHTSLAGTDFLYLNATDATVTNAAMWNSTVPTSSVFSLGTNAGVNNSGDAFVAYCWSEIAGFSKFGSYTGNGSTDGTFVYTGFRPRYILIKNTGFISGYGDWYILDTVRNTYNVANSALRTDTSDQEYTNTAYNIDILSNGFKLRTSYNDFNASSYTYIYMAFAENPFKNSLAR